MVNFKVCIYLTQRCTGLKTLTVMVNKLMTKDTKNDQPDQNVEVGGEIAT